MYFVSLLFVFLILQYKHGIKKHRREFRYDNVINLCLTLFFFLSKLKNTISCWLKVWDRKLIKVNRAFTEKQNLQNWKFFCVQKEKKLKKHAKGFSFCVRNTILTLTCFAAYVFKPFDIDKRKFLQLISHGKLSSKLFEFLRSLGIFLIVHVYLNTYFYDNFAV